MTFPSWDRLNWMYTRRKRERVLPKRDSEMFCQRVPDGLASLGATECCEVANEISSIGNFAQDHAGFAGTAEGVKHQGTALIFIKFIAAVFEKFPECLSNTTCAESNFSLLEIMDCLGGPIGDIAFDVMCALEVLEVVQNVKSLEHQRRLGHELEVNDVAKSLRSSTSDNTRQYGHRARTSLGSCHWIQPAAKLT